MYADFRHYFRQLSFRCFRAAADFAATPSALPMPPGSSAAATRFSSPCHFSQPPACHIDGRCLSVIRPPARRRLTPATLLPTAFCRCLITRATRSPMRICPQCPRSADAQADAEDDYAARHYYFTLITLIAAHRDAEIFRFSVYFLSMTFSLIRLPASPLCRCRHR